MKRLERQKELYDDLDQRKNEIEQNKNNIIDDLEKIAATKKKEIDEANEIINSLKKQLLDKQKEIEYEKSILKEVIINELIICRN